MRSHPLLRPVRLATLLAVGALGASAGPAAAELVTYVDGSPRNVWAENVDGSERRQLTTDATASRLYSYPSVNDAGDLAVIMGDNITGNPAIVFVPRGGQRIVNLMPAWGLGVTAPFGARIQPEGRLLAYTFGRFHGSGQSSAGNVVPADAPGSPTGPGPGFPNMLGATWHAGKLVWTSGGAIAYGTGAETAAWIGGVSFGEVSRDATRLLATLDQSPRKLAFQALTGPMPAQADESVGGCIVPHTGTLGDAALSPSGRWVAFRDDAGLHVAQIAIPGGSAEACTLTGARVVSATADDPAFSTVTLGTPPQPPETGRDPPQERPGGERPGGERPSGGRPRGAPRATVAATTLRAALQKGLVVRLSGLPAGRTTVAARLGRTLVASARVRVPASGKASLRLRFTAAGRRALKGKRRATLTVTAGKARTSVKLRQR